MAELFICIIVWFLEIPKALQICATVFCALAFVCKALDD